MVATVPYTERSRDRLWQFLLAGAVTSIVDGLFASVLSLVYGSTPTRLWQGVASTLLGPSSMTGGARTAAIGVLMHICVAFAWSAVFVFGVMRSEGVQRVLSSSYGALKVAAVFGPLIWMGMSLVLVPLLVHRPPAISVRWWIQLLAHIPFVAIPMVTTATMVAKRMHVRS
jgi:putative flippase GtrA